MTNSNLIKVLEELKSREPIFHHPEFGTSRAYYENMTDVNFWEVGASGKRYDREDVIETCIARYKNNNYSKNDIWEAKNFECREIALNSYLLTYTLIQGVEKRITHRATIWQLVDNNWQIFYHQGTIIENNGHVLAK
ncbi:MAG: hypothetical protein QG673_1066 [Pseudomonadota bacterium]|nr:hypothetical protein [Pseudomonadota bacterium]